MIFQNCPLLRISRTGITFIVKQLLSSVSNRILWDGISSRRHCVETSKFFWHSYKGWPRPFFVKRNGNHSKTKHFWVLTPLYNFWNGLGHPVFYVKSIFGILEVEKLPFLPFSKVLNFVFWSFSAFKQCKNSSKS